MCTTEIDAKIQALTKKVAQETDRLAEELLESKGYVFKRTKEGLREVVQKLNEKGETLVSKLHLNKEKNEFTLYVDIIPIYHVKSWYQILEEGIENGKI